VKPHFSFNPEKSTHFFDFWIEVVSKPLFAKGFCFQKKDHVEKEKIG